jgi:biotin operon repressor
MKKKAKTTAQALTTVEPAQLVTKALEDSRYEWRSIEGISEQTGLSQDQVRHIIEKMEDEIVRSSVPDEKGRSLYTTRQHYRATHGLGARLLDALAGRVA